ncbi:MAG: hypothetical protein KDK91_20745, partial [Gammaproteobacteria bacterium]|nr:hypothetical protein [Gammaproteobacteria bacterium]
GDMTAAIQTLDDLWLEKPETYDRRMLVRNVLLHLEMEQPGLASARAQAWLKINPEPSSAIELAGLFERYRALAPALAILQALPGELRVRADVYAQVTRLRIELGEAGDMLAEMLADGADATLSEVQTAALVELALYEGRYRIATERAKLLSLQALPEWTLTALVEAALQVDQPARALEIFEAIPSGTLAANPVLAAQLSLRLALPEGALLWAHAAEADARGALRIALAEVYLRLERREDCFRLLDSVQVGELVPVEAASLARLYLTLDAAPRGLASLARAGIRDGETWALLASAADRESEVLDWLRGVPEASLREAGLGELQDLAAQRGQVELAMLAAQLGHRRFSGAVWRIRLAESHLVADQVPPARALLEGLDRQSLHRDQLYRRALYAAHRAGMPVTAELQALAREVLALEGSGSEAVRTLAYDLLGIKAQVAALPLLEPLSALRPDEWFLPYVDALVADGRAEQAVALLAARLDALIDPPDEIPPQDPVMTKAVVLAAPDLETQLALEMGLERWSAELLLDATWAGDSAAQMREASIWASLERLDALGAAELALDGRRRLALAEPVSKLDWYHAYMAGAAVLLQASSEDPVATERLHESMLATIQTLLDRPGRDDAGNEALVFALVEHAGARLALPQLRRLAAQGGAVEQVYRDSLRALGLREELVRHLNALASRLAPDQAKALADELLSLGEKPLAVSIYQRLAQDAAPDSEAIQQLRYLWGPRPDDDAMRWLLARMEDGPDRQQQAWGELILELGGAARLVARLDQTASAPGADPALALLYLRAIARSASKSVLAARIRQLIDVSSQLDNLRGLAGLADSADLPDLAVLAYTRVLAQLPDDIEAL